MRKPKVDGRMRDDRIIDPKVAAGEPVIRATRLTVQFILELLANGWSQEEVIENYPGLTADVRACLACASERLAEEEVIARRG